MKNIFKEIPELNVKRGGARTIGVILLIGVLAFSLFLTAFVSLSMKNGLEMVERRLGADVVIIPNDAQDLYTGALLGGVPSLFYIEEDILDEIDRVEGVIEYTPQLYISSLSASCCSFPVQIIGIDLDTDFAVSPWLESQTQIQLGENNVIAGKNINPNYDGSVTFYEKPFNVVGSLDKTGMGFDNSIFMSLDDARDLALRSQEYGVTILNDTSDLISCVLLNIEDDIRPSKFTYDLKNKLEKYEISALSSDSILSETALQISNSTLYINIILSIIWILCVIVLLIMFPIMIRSRSRELSVVRILGATKKQMTNLLIREVLIMSLIGSVSGSILSLLVSELFKNTISVSLDIPFLVPSFSSLILIVVLAIIICTIIGVLASCVSIRRLNKQELAIATREND